MASPGASNTVTLDNVIRDYPNMLRDAEQANRLDILVVGKIGVGKSTLVNGLVGYEIAQTGAGVDPVTSEVNKYSANMNGVEITVFDTPGFHADTHEPDDVILRSVRQALEGRTPDLILYCIDMNGRWDKPTSIALRRVLSLVDHWRSNAQRNNISILCVLMRANAVEEADYNYKMTGFTKKFLEATQSEVQIGEEDESKYMFSWPVVPAGYRESRLPDCDDWLSRLWLTALTTLGQNGNWPAACAIFKSSQERLDIKGDTSQKIPMRRRIYVGLIYSPSGLLILAALATTGVAAITYLAAPALQPYAERLVSCLPNLTNVTHALEGAATAIVASKDLGEVLLELYREWREYKHLNDAT